MPLFDTYIAVDWSANNEPKSGKDSIWSCLGDEGAIELRVANHRTRRAAEAWLLGALTAAARARKRVLVGLDFPYGYPTGFAAALEVEGEPWKGVWAYLDRHVRDDERNVSNRFDVAADVNRQLGRYAPFWGRPKHLMLPSLPFLKEVAYLGPHESGGLSEWRQVEQQLHRVRIWPQSVWKLFGPGTVGSQSLVGIPVVRRLRDHAALRDVSRVWPFEVLVPNLHVGSPAVVHAEIWPSIVPFAHEMGSCPDEQQVRAVVQHWRRLDRVDQLAGLFAAAPDNISVRHEEGWVLGVPVPGTEITFALPARSAPGAMKGPSRSGPAPTRARTASPDRQPCLCGCGNFPRGERPIHARPRPADQPSNRKALQCPLMLDSAWASRRLLRPRRPPPSPTLTACRCPLQIRMRLRHFDYTSVRVASARRRPVHKRSSGSHFRATRIT